MEKLKAQSESVLTKARDFLYTDIYILTVLAIVFIAWVTQCATFGFVALIAISCVALVLSDDILPLTVNIFGAVLMIYKGSVAEYVYLLPTLIPLGVAIIVFIVRNFKKRMTFGKMFLPQLAVSCALLLGGVGVVSSERYLVALPISIALGFGVLAVYLLYANFFNRQRKTDVGAYFAKVMSYIGIAVGLELIVAIVRCNLSSEQWSGAYFDVGWGNRNNIATYLLFAAPFSIYLSTRKKHGWIYVLVSVFQYACLIMTLSRGGILCGFIAGLFALVFSIVKAPDRRKQAVYWVCVFVAIGILAAIFHDWVGGVLDSLMTRVKVDGDVSSGRFDLYKEAWSLFKKYPFAGAGMGYNGYNAGMLNDMGLYWFHSTVFQILGCLGIVGVLAYVWFYVKRILIFAKKAKSGFALFVFAAWFGFEGYSLIDTGTMSPYPFMMLVIVTTFLLEVADDTNYETVVGGIPKRLYDGATYVRQTF